MGTPGSLTRERILRAALDLAGREGLDALTTRRVAAEAGVNLGLLHYYFDSKEALVAETLGTFLAGLRSSVEVLDADEGDPEAALSGFFIAALDRAFEVSPLVFGLLTTLTTTMTQTLAAGTEAREALAKSPPAPMAEIADIQRLVVGRVRRLLSLRLGRDETLLSRRCLQLFASLLHPVFFTPFPGLIFGIASSDRAERAAYVRAVVADACLPPHSRESEATRKET